MARMGLLGLVAALAAGCALVTANPDDDAQARMAALVGGQAGNAACVVALTERPELVGQLADVVAQGQAVLASPDPTLAAINTAVAAIDDPKARLYVSVGVNTVLATLVGTGVEVRTIEPGSPVAVGFGALFDGCALALGGAA